MRAGGLRFTATVQRQDNTPDAFGTTGDAWATVATVRCSVEPLNGREWMAAHGEASAITTRVRMRYESALATFTPADRLVIDGRNYDVESVINVANRNRELVVMCRAT